MVIVFSGVLYAFEAPQRLLDIKNDVNCIKLIKNKIYKLLYYYIKKDVLVN